MNRKPVSKQKVLRSPREDGDVTREKIIEAAGKLFAERGFAETENKDIAKLAKVSVTSINYHFGSRELLYEAVIQRVSGVLLDPAVFEKVEKSGVSAWKKLQALVEYCTRVDEGGWEIRFWLREAIAPSPGWRKMCDNDFAPTVDVIMKVLSEATGIPEGAPELEMCFFNMTAPTTLFMLTFNHEEREISLPSETFGFSEISENIKEFILAGIKKAALNYKKKHKA